MADKVYMRATAKVNADSIFGNKKQNDWQELFRQAIERAREKMQEQEK
jgi:hypothetical protein